MLAAFLLVVAVWGRYRWCLRKHGGPLAQAAGRRPDGLSRSVALLGSGYWGILSGRADSGPGVPSGRLLGRPTTHYPVAVRDRSGGVECIKGREAGAGQGGSARLGRGPGKAAFPGLPLMAGAGAVSAVRPAGLLSARCLVRARMGRYRACYR
ncbi:hypothetical protein GCM10025734_56700 [Kitasatospora paranensis]